MRLGDYDFKSFWQRRRELREESRRKLQDAVNVSFDTPEPTEEEIAKQEARAKAKAEHNRLADLRGQAKRRQPINWAMFGLVGNTTAYIDGSRAEAKDDAAIEKAIRSAHNNGVRRRYKKLQKAEDVRAETIRRSAPGYVIGEKTRADRRKAKKTKRAQHLEEKTARTSFADRKTAEAEIYQEAMRRWSRMDAEHRPRLRSLQAVVAAERGVQWRDYTQNGGTV